MRDEAFFSFKGSLMIYSKEYERLESISVNS
ncbi:Uncharacterised protein [Streptococcus pneumoniae]|nr:Uncharacterised protein [Streptococcus pneumoniae]CKE25382.1 Uncharacterised protein [Streptococcus pneumoniae]CKG11657.1 Uncharacterised protein [Streptococcus pneumoniae]